MAVDYFYLFVYGTYRLEASRVSIRLCIYTISIQFVTHLIWDKTRSTVNFIRHICIHNFCYIKVRTILFLTVNLMNLSITLIKHCKSRRIVQRSGVGKVGVRFQTSVALQISISSLTGEKGAALDKLKYPTQYNTRLYAQKKRYVGM
jgi:hypothetical protein